MRVSRATPPAVAALLRERRSSTALGAGIAIVTPLGRSGGSFSTSPDDIVRAMADLKHSLVLAILAFLEQERTARTDADAVESLLVASECLSRVFAVRCDAARSSLGRGPNSTNRRRDRQRAAAGRDAGQRPVRCLLPRSGESRADCAGAERGAPCDRRRRAAGAKRRDDVVCDNDNDDNDDNDDNYDRTFAIATSSRIIGAFSLLCRV